MRRDLPSGTVTFLFTDIEGSTKLLHELGEDERGRALHDENLQRARALHNEHVEASTLGARAMIAVDEGRLDDAVSALKEPAHSLQP